MSIYTVIISSICAGRSSINSMFISVYIFMIYFIF